jgi:hypothetical protein
MMKKQTAVELLIKSFEERIKNGNTHHCLHDLLAQLHQAKQMEKQQIIDANDSGFADGVTDRDDGVMRFKTAEQYYNETYSK